MNEIRELHEQAMDSAELAAVARLRGDLDRAEQLLEEALRLEASAARSTPDDASAEPTRSILFRSAASLALELGEDREAERLIGAALSGNPPEGVAEELRELYEGVVFQRYLSRRDLALAPAEFLMTIAGKAFATGIAPAKELVGRIQDAERIVVRTVERKLGKPYREAGRPSREAKEYSVYVRAEAPASFAVSLRLTQPKQIAIPQLKDRFAFLEAPEIIDEIMTCLELFSRTKGEELRTRIDEPAYYNQFVNIAKRLAPDGKVVKTVGFRSISNGEERRVALTESEVDMPTALETRPEDDEGAAAERTTVRGTLLFADARDSESNKIRLVDETRKTHRILVPEGMMTDIVKPLWEEQVIVTGPLRGRSIMLEDIRRAPLEE